MSKPTDLELEVLLDEFCSELRASDVDDSEVSLKTSLADIKYDCLDSLMFDMGVDDNALGALDYGSTVGDLLTSAAPFLE